MHSMLGSRPATLAQAGGSEALLLTAETGYRHPAEQRSETFAPILLTPGDQILRVAVAPAPRRKESRGRSRAGSKRIATLVPTQHCFAYLDRVDAGSGVAACPHDLCHDSLHVRLPGKYSRTSRQVALDPGQRRRRGRPGYTHRRAEARRPQIVRTPCMAQVLHQVYRLQ